MQMCVFRQNIILNLLRCLMLRTLGGLALTDADFKRQKPLLLLAYLTLEGRKERRYVAELFWPDAAHALTSLSVALSQLRKVSQHFIEADDRYVSSSVASDATTLLEYLDKSDLEAAVALYEGQFLDGLSISLGEELEEWLYKTREYLAARVRGALLRQADAALKTEKLDVLRQLAEQAYSLVGAVELEPEDFERFYAFFKAANSDLLPALRKDAESYGIHLKDAVLAPAVGRVTPVQLSHLPVAATPLVGRDPELLELRQLLEQGDCRLLTLVGLGGIGKTKLSLHLAHELVAQAAFVEGVYFVELDAITTRAALLSALAEVLSLELTGSDDAFEQLCRFLGVKRCLLVLDNFEQLTAVALVLSDLLKRCANLKLLLSSRERLNLSEEWVYELEGLSVPEAAIALEDALYYDAIQLFLQRAKRVSLRFALAPDNLPYVIQVCQKVEGVPLGIELAASWLQLMRASEIAAEVTKNFDFLESDMRNMPERHRSLRAAFEQSWQLLSVKDQAVLSKLSAFQNGFRRQAASEVADASLFSLASLVNKSLLRVSEQGRYDRHPLIYQYSLEKLERSSNADGVLGKHARYFLASFSSLNALPLGFLAEELENIKAAWQHALKTRSFILIEGILIGFSVTMDAVAKYAFASERLAELIETLRHFENNDKLLGRVLCCYSLMLTRLGQFADAAQVSFEGLELVAAQQDQEGLVWGHYFAALLATFKGEQEAAKAHIQLVLDNAGTAGASLIANSYDRLGSIEQALGHYDKARGDYKKSLALHRELDNKTDVVTVLLHLGTLELNTGIFMGKLESDASYVSLAEGLYQESLGLAKEIGKAKDVPILLHNLANIAMRRGDYPKAYSLAQEALGLVQERGERNREAGMLATLSWIAMTANDLQEATVYVQEGLSLAYDISDQPSVLTNLVRLVELWEKEGHKEQAIYLAHYVAEHRSSLAWTSKRAKRFLDTWQIPASLNTSALELVEIDDLVSHLLQNHLKTLPVLA